MREPDEDAMKQVAGVCPAWIRQCHVRAVSGSAYDLRTGELLRSHQDLAKSSGGAEQSISGLVVCATSTYQLPMVLFNYS